MKIFERNMIKYTRKWCRNVHRELQMYAFREAIIKPGVTGKTVKTSLVVSKINVIDFFLCECRERK